VARRTLQAGCTLSSDQIVITSGCVEAVMLALRAICKPGETLAIESPVYFNFMQLIEGLEATMGGLVRGGRRGSWELP